MNEPINFGHCLSFINLQLKPNANAVVPADHKARWRGITISRQAGTGGHMVAEEVANYLRLHARRARHRGWFLIAISWKKFWKFIICRRVSRSTCRKIASPAFRTRSMNYLGSTRRRGRSSKKPATPSSGSPSSET